MKTKKRKTISSRKHFLVASDFDKTLSFNDSGFVLAQMLGIGDFDAKVDALSDLNLVQQGGELAYLLLHDSAFKSVRREHLVETGKLIKLKHNIELLTEVLNAGFDDYRFSFYVISAAPEEIIQSALQGIVPKENIFGTRLKYDSKTGEIIDIQQVSAGYGKVAVLKHIQSQQQISDNRVIYSGDGSSDVHVMLHINQRKGFTIAVSQAEYLAQIAKRTVMSDDAMSVLIPVFEDICQWDSARIREFFEGHGLLIQEWAKMRTDWLTIGHDR